MEQLGLEGILAAEKERRERLYRRSLPEKRTLVEALSCLSREELDDMAYNLCLEGTEEMTFSALVETLAPAVCRFSERWLPSAFDEQYQAFRHIREQGGLAADFRVDDERLDYLCGLGLLAVGAADGKLFWYMPEEIAAVFSRLDSPSYGQAVQTNTEIMRLATGLLFYYGFLDYDRLFSMVSALLEKEQRIEFFSFMGVLLNGSCWQKNVVGHERGMSYHTVLDPAGIEAQQKEKDGLPFAEISYGKAYDAGEDGYIEATDAYKGLAQFFMAQFGFDVLHAADTVGKILILMQNGGSMKEVAAFLETLGEIEEEAAAAELSRLVIELHGTTRLWRLKGHTPRELQENAAALAGSFH